MIGKPPKGLFITGTNTGVGKTFVASAILRTLVARGVQVGVYKPVLSGCRSVDSELPALEDSDDDRQLWLAANRPGTYAEVCPQRFRAPLAPHLAAQSEGRAVDSTLLRTGIHSWQHASEFVVVEGAGGLFSPLTFDELNADLAADLDYPLLLVAANTLGVIHATLATLYAARSYHRPLIVAAIVLNDIPGNRSDPSCASNFAELERRCAPCPVFRHEQNRLDVPDEFAQRIFLKAQSPEDGGRSTEY